MGVILLTRNEVLLMLAGKAVPWTLKMRMTRGIEGSIRKRFNPDVVIARQPATHR